MARLINLDKELARLQKETWMRAEAETSVIRMFLSKAKEVDAVEVVRCGKCRYFEVVDYYPDGTKDICRLLKRQVPLDGFCFCGER